MEEIFLVESKQSGQHPTIENLWQTLFDAESYVSVKIQNSGKSYQRILVKEDNIILRYFESDIETITIKKMHVN